MRRRIVVACGAALIAVLGLACFFAESGGEDQFSPFTLDRRNREYLYVAGVRVYSSPWSYRRDCLAQFLVGAGYWEPVEAADPRWISMTEWRGHSSGHIPFANALSSSWVLWSVKHPDLAGRVWPYVLKLLRGPPLDYAGIGIMEPSAVVVDVLAKLRRVRNTADLERDLKLFDELATPAPGGEVLK